jgi:hypothetical protein
MKFPIILHSALNQKLTILISLIFLHICIIVSNANSQSDTLYAMVILIKFPEQKSPLPSADYAKKSLDMYVNQWYGHSTKWRVKPIRFIVTEYYALTQPYATYQEGYNNLGWEPHFDLLEEVITALADKKIMVKGSNGTLTPADLSKLSTDASKKVLSIGTCYYPLDAEGRAYGNSSFWPQSDAVSQRIKSTWNVSVGSYSYGFFDLVPNNVFTDPAAMQCGAMIHEIGHAFLDWPDVEETTPPFGNDWELVKRLSRVNRATPHEIIKSINTVPSGSTVSVAAGHWSVWGYRNPADTNEYIAIENIATKGYTKNINVKGSGLAFYNIHIKNQDQYIIEADPVNASITSKDYFYEGNQAEFSTSKFSKAKWRNGTSLPFTITNISASGDVMTFKITGSASGTAINAGTAEPDALGYPVELFDASSGTGTSGAFGRTRYCSWNMSAMGITSGVASSVKIFPGAQVLLYDKDECTGTSITLFNKGTAAKLFTLDDYGFDNKVKSLDVSKANVEAFTPVTTIPVLLAPSDKMVNQPIPTVLSWNTVNSAKWYRLQIATDSTFKTTVYDNYSISNGTVTVNQLVINTQYYWRVKAINEGSFSGWSTRWSFRTASQISSVLNEKRTLLVDRYSFGKRSVSFTLVKAQDVSIQLTNVTGRSMLVYSKRMHSAGTFLLNFQDKKLSAGIYVLSCKGSDFVQNETIIVTQ